MVTSHSGVGGPELAAESLGWDIIASCEIDKNCQRVLKYYWPNTYHHDDIHTFTRKKIEEETGWTPKKPTVYVASIPCQPFSNAGRRKGSQDDRYHWPVVLGFIKGFRPDWFVFENVAGLTTMVFEPKIDRVETQALIEGEEVYVSMVGEGILNRICDELEREDYTCQTYEIPVGGLDAAHRRSRVFIVAHCNIRRRQYEEKELFPGWRAIISRATGFHRDTHGSGQGDTNTGADQGQAIEIRWDEEINVSSERDLTPDGGSEEGAGGRRGLPADSDGKLPQGGDTRRTSGQAVSENPSEFPYVAGRWTDLLSQSPILSDNDELSGRLVGITFPKHREFSARSYGNAIAPAHILPIFEVIEEVQIILDNL